MRKGGVEWSSLTIFEYAKRDKNSFSLSPSEVLEWLCNERWTTDELFHDKQRICSTFCSVHSAQIDLLDPSIVAMLENNFEFQKTSKFTTHSLLNWILYNDDLCDVNYLKTHLTWYTNMERLCDRNRLGFTVSLLTQNILSFLPKQAAATHKKRALWP
jgi:hypothetical protein